MGRSAGRIHPVVAVFGASSVYEAVTMVRRDAYRDDVPLRTNTRVHPLDREKKTGYQRGKFQNVVK